MTNNLIADIGYVGSHGSHLPFVTDLNQVPENLLGPNDAASVRIRVPELTGYTTDGISNYHAFQAESRAASATV